MLKIKDMNLNNVIRQGDSQPREYQLDTGNLDLNLTNKSATIRLMTADFQGIGYETTATVSSENKISFSIDDVIPARQYRLEVTVDDYVFPSRATDGQLSIDPSSHGQEVNIINVIGKEEIVRDVKSRVENELEPFLGEIEQAELDRQAQEVARETAEGERETTESQRKADHANRSAEFDGKADKFVLKNLVKNGDFSTGLSGWKPFNSSLLEIEDGLMKVMSVNNSLQMGQEVDNVIDDVYYTYLIFKSDTPDFYFLSTNQSNSYGVENISDFQMVSVHEKRKNGFIVTLNRAPTPSKTVAYVKEVGSFNLTQTFGAGNEPTKEEMDEFIKVIGYIDGEYALNNKDMLGHLMNSISQKANKKQEEWIAPTLLNGWEAGRCRFRLTSLGELEIDVRNAKNGITGLSVFNFPPGYRMASDKSYIVPVVQNILSLASASVGQFDLVFTTTDPAGNHSLYIKLPMS